MDRLRQHFREAGTTPITSAGREQLRVQLQEQMKGQIITDDMLDKVSNYCLFYLHGESNAMLESASDFYRCVVDAVCTDGATPRTYTWISEDKLRSHQPVRGRQVACLTLLFFSDTSSQALME